MKQNLFKEKERKSLAVAFSLTFRYIDEVLSIKNCHSHYYVNSIYPSKLLEIKNTMGFDSSVLYSFLIFYSKKTLMVTLQQKFITNVMISIFL